MIFNGRLMKYVPDDYWKQEIVDSDAPIWQNNGHFILESNDYEIENAGDWEEYLRNPEADKFVFPYETHGITFYNRNDYESWERGYYGS